MIPRKGFRSQRGGMPGKGGMDPKAMNAAMKQMGIQTEDMEGVEEVIIRTASVDYVIREAQVTKMTVQGQSNYQIVGEAEMMPRGSAAGSQGPAGGQTQAQAAKAPVFSEADIEIVMGQTGCTRESAIKALGECDGQPAEAIMKLIS